MELQPLLGLEFWDGRLSTASDSPTPGNSPAPGNNTAGLPRRIQGWTFLTWATTVGEVSGPLGAVCVPVQARRSYLQPQRARADTQDTQSLQAGINGVHEKYTQASRDMLRQISPGVEEVFGGSEGQLERSIEILLEITSDG